MGLQMNDQHGSVMWVFDAYRDIIHAKGIGAFMAIYDEDVHVFDSWAQWGYVGVRVRRVMVTVWFSRSHR